MKKENFSRVGRQPVPIPEGVTVETKDDKVFVKGPKGNLALKVRPEIGVKISESQVLVFPKKKSKLAKSLHGLTRTLIANTIDGVLKDYSKKLRLVGTGYRAKIEDSRLFLTLGFSHPVIVQPEKGIKFDLEGDDLITVSGIDKQLVGQVAAKIRSFAPPEPYKGKGIRYEGEVVRKKPGKAAKIGEGEK